MRTITYRVLMAAVAMLVVCTAEGQAQSWQGSVCWQLDSFSDRVRTGLMLLPDGQYDLTVKWSSATWQYNGNGSASVDATVPGTYRLSFSSAGNTANHSCDLTASLNTTTLSGPWRFECRSGFVNSGTNMHIVACPASEAALADEGPTSMSSSIRQ